MEEKGISVNSSRGCYVAFCSLAVDLVLSRIDHITWTSSYPHAITSPCRSITLLSCSEKKIKKFN